MPGGVINTGTHPKLLWPGIYATWGQVYQGYTPQYTACYEVRDSDKAYEQAAQVTDFTKMIHAHFDHRVSMC